MPMPECLRHGLLYFHFMRYIYSFLFTFLATSSLWGQEGFIKTYEFEGAAGCAFHNIISKQDTLIILGTRRVDSLDQWGVLLAKADTFGNILDHRVYTDSLGDFMTLVPNYSIIRTEDNGYLITGIFLYRESGFLLKVDVNGNVEFVKEFPDSTALTIDQRKVLEVPGGYLVAGSKQKPDYAKDIFVMKTDKQGNNLWERQYGVPNIDEITGSFLQIDENTFILGAGKSSKRNSAAPLEKVWGKSKFFAIDSLGNLKWEWEAPTINDALGTIGLHHLDNGSWVYSSRTFEITNPNDPFGSISRGRIIKRDSNFNIVWEKTVGLPTSYQNAFIELEATPDGGWVAVGQMAEPIIGEHPNPLSAWMHKVSAEGETEWERLDTVLWHPVSGSVNYTGGATVLPSGAIVACGYNNQYLPTARSYGWLIKVDARGCIEAGCNPVSVSVQAPEWGKWKVYPNPAFDVLNIELEGAQPADAEIIDSFGKVVLKKAGLSGLTTLDISGLPAGGYFVRLMSGGRAWVGKVVKALK